MPKLESEPNSQASNTGRNVIRVRVCRRTQIPNLRNAALLAVVVGLPAIGHANDDPDERHVDTNTATSRFAPGPSTENSLESRTAALQSASTPTALNSGLDDGLPSPTLEGAPQRLEQLASDMLGDRIDLNTGTLAFRHVDVELAGNSGLPVAFSRTRMSRSSQGHKPLQRHEMGDWRIEAPKISTFIRANANWKNARCSGSSEPEPIPNPLDWGRAQPVLDYWDGLTLNVPGLTNAQILDNPTHRHHRPGTRKATVDGWVIDCISSIPGGGEGFYARSPDGNRYRFDQLFYEEAEPAVQAYPYPGVLPSPKVARRRAVLYASEVIDPSGAWVRYEYSAYGYLTRVHASDGREIVIWYGPPPISATVPWGPKPVVRSVRVNGRIWEYIYGPATGCSSNSKECPLTLNRVVLPDSRYWTFSLWRMDVKPNCYLFGETTVSLRHPSGMTGNFRLGHTLQGRTRVPVLGPAVVENSCEVRRQGRFQKALATISVKSKTLEGPAYPAATWSYEYANDRGSYVGATNPASDNKWTQVTDPTGRRTVYTYNRRFNGALEGLLVERTVYPSAAAAAPTETIDYQYIIETAVGSLNRPNVSTTRHRQPRRLSEQRTTRDRILFRTQYSYSTNRMHSTYSHGMPTRIVRFSSEGGAARVTDITYRHDLSRWIIGKREQVEENYKLFHYYRYDSLGRVTRHERFGRLWATFGYHHTHGQRGALAWKQDALGRRTSYRNYNRGQPQTIVRADGSQLRRTIDNNGWLTAETNARGYTTRYRYNNVGWLTSIDRPAGWTDTTITYPNSGTVDFSRIETRGSEQVRAYLDAAHRPFFTHRRAISGGGGSVYTNTKYDALGRVVYRSLPFSALPPGTADLYATSGSYDGSTMKYDSLNRLIQMRETHAPHATISYNYFSNARRVRDAQGNYSTTFFRSYGSPDDKIPVRIEQPGGIRTEYYYDIYGNLIAAEQSGNQNGFSVSHRQRYYYDSSNRLCRHSVPEQGDTVFVYDDADQLIQSNRAMPPRTLPHTICAAGVRSAGIVRTYDLLGRETFVDYPPGTPDVVKGYDRDGNLIHIARGIVKWDYKYDTLNHLTEEKLRLDGLTFTAQYEYNADSHLEFFQSPSGRQYLYSANGLGQQTEVRYPQSTLYAGRATYHPNGTLAGLRYRNGQVLSIALDNRQLVSSIRVADGATVPIDYRFVRDQSGRTTYRYDLARLGFHASYTYDGIGRLISAYGPWGSGSFTYDALGNIRRKRLGQRLVQLSYDSNNRMSAFSDSSQGNGVWQQISYDANGNALNTGLSTMTGVNLSYDAFDRPVSVTGSATGSFYYDGHGHRVKQVINGETIYSIYSISGALLYRHFPASKPKDMDYVRLAGRTVALLRGGGSSLTASYVHQDELGSAVAATDDQGRILWRESYTPYGEKRNQPADNDDGEGFTSHIEDTDTGLTYMKARYYDSRTGRFLSPDPVQLSLEQPRLFNRYAYAFNDPVNAVDPTGQIPLLLAAGGAVALKNAAFSVGLPVAVGVIAGGIGNHIGSRGSPGSFTDGAIAGGVAGLTFTFIGKGILASTFVRAGASGVFGSVFSQTSEGVRNGQSIGESLRSINRYRLAGAGFGAVTGHFLSKSLSLGVTPQFTKAQEYTTERIGDLLESIASGAAETVGGKLGAGSTNDASVATPQSPTSTDSRSPDSSDVLPLPTLPQSPPPTPDSNIH